MRAVQTGNTFKVYDDSMQVYHMLPTQAYCVSFEDRSGFYLSKYADIRINEKVYGIHEAKVNKVLNSFEAFTRNLGVILSGDKGIGKSLFAKLLARRAMDSYDLPLIIVNAYHPGIAEYLNAIDQEVMVLFDEFDKTFMPGNGYDPQAEMLTLFDGISQGKKLFVVTCNDLRNLNNYLVNRPGRFHYHFRFEYPKATDIKEYLKDKIPAEMQVEIPKVIGFAHKVPLNYDCLRAIAFELSLGLKFEDAIADLNILRGDREEFNLLLYFDDGSHLRRNSVYFDSFDDEETCAEFRDTETGLDVLYCRFIPYESRYDMNLGTCCIPGEKVRIEIEENYLRDDPQGDKLIQIYKNKKVSRLELHRVLNRNIHYAL